MPILEVLCLNYGRAAFGIGIIAKCGTDKNGMFIK